MVPGSKPLTVTGEMVWTTPLPVMYCAAVLVGLVDNPATEVAYWYCTIFDAPDAASAEPERVADPDEDPWGVLTLVAWLVVTADEMVKDWIEPYSVAPVQSCATAW